VAGRVQRASVLGALVMAAEMLAGCGPQAPAYRDSLADLSTARGVDVPIDMAVTAGPRPAFTFGSNIDAFLKYHDDGVKFAATMGASKQLLADGDPQLLVDGGVSILRRHYPDIKPVEDLKSAARESFSTTFVLDIRTKAGIWPGDETTIDLMIIALDAQMKPVSRLMGHGATTIRPYQPPNVGEANRQAIADLDAKAARLLQ
jgi:hypothetical protein